MSKRRNLKKEKQERNRAYARKFRRYDLVIMDDITNETISNSNNMDKYYEVAVELNNERMLHWKKYREIANEEQIKKLDSIWNRIKDRIRSSN